MTRCCVALHGYAGYVFFLLISLLILCFVLCSGKGPHVVLPDPERRARVAVRVRNETNTLDLRHETVGGRTTASTTRLLATRIPTPRTIADGLRGNAALLRGPDASGSLVSRVLALSWIFLVLLFPCVYHGRILTMTMTVMKHEPRWIESACWRLSIGVLHFFVSGSGLVTLDGLVKVCVFEHSYVLSLIRRRGCRWRGEVYIMFIEDSPFRILALCVG